MPEKSGQWLRTAKKDRVHLKCGVTAENVKNTVDWLYQQYDSTSMDGREKHNISRQHQKEENEILWFHILVLMADNCWIRLDNVCEHK